MKIIRASEQDSDLIEYLTKETINITYPRYYASGAVDFFLAHHHHDAILRDLREADVFLLYDSQEVAIATITLKGNEICRLFVLPTYQHQGYGKKLLAFAERYISKSYDTIVLDASLPAKQFYVNKGYVVTCSQTICTLNGDFLCYDVMTKHALQLGCRIQYDGKRFTPKCNSDHGEVSSQTIFHYHQKGSLLWAEYAGGEIVKGFLIGNVDREGNLTFSYQHVNDRGYIRMGECKSTPVILDNGLLELHETWQWLNMDTLQGNSILIEIRNDERKDEPQNE